MDRCKHVGRLRLAPDHSILNPQKWHCVDCNTSESMWACLGCAHVACGRYIEEHALQHFRQQRHPLAMEVNELYVFCYLCDDYVLNDNATGDLKLLRSTLSAIQSQRYEVTTRSGRTLRSASSAPDAVMPSGARELQLRDEDRMFTALWHRRRALMGRLFRCWFGLTDGGKKREEEERKKEEEEEQRREARERRRLLKRRQQEELENAPLRKSRRLRGRSQRGADAATSPPGTKTRAQGPAQTSRTQGPAQTSRTQGPAQTSRTQGPAQTSRTQGPTQTSRIQGPTQTSRTQGPTQTSRTQGPAQTSRSQGPAQTSRSQGPAQTSRSQGPAQTSRSQGPAQTSRTQGPAQTSRTQGPTQTSRSQGPTQTSRTQGPAQTAKRGTKKVPAAPKPRIHPKPRPAPATRSAQTPVRRKPGAKPGGSPLKRRPTVTPGVTGLRNLGNTCYMNSILQVLSHLLVFRECFLHLDLTPALELLASSVHDQLAAKSSSPLSHRKGFQTGWASGAGLSGGASRGRSMELIQPKEPSSKHISLCHELHTLFQVMWSGKWALVSPFAMLHSVWQLIPAFRGYAQQDAQEFLCELLDKVQRELESSGQNAAGGAAPQKRLIKQVLSVVNTIFHGQLLSQVTCLACDHRSDTVEPFWDLSLEFPERYHSNSRESAAQTSCHLTEMLAKFTETEALEGNIYACDRCNSARRRTSSKSVLLTEARKQLMVHKLPQVLRLHLKRFRWSGRNHREKIGVHVSFDQRLNMEPFCTAPKAPPGGPKHFLYDLSAVVMHHGKGFGSGHYTSYCYNTEGGFWVHCNDSKLSVCAVEEACRAQAYILFYTRRAAQDKDRPR